ncbi:nitroreductase family deazaflavin-dependent oxidoreductase [Myxococcota bacterium]|nr:nitroreductase family deazaflavin-dependent oxidoreductase [Myxococcota bacterium]
MSESDDHRPATTAEKETFSSGGRRHLILLRGKWGLAIDRGVFLATGYSPMTKQYCFAQGHPYQKTLMLSTIGARTGKIRRANLPFFEVDGDLVVRGSNGGGPTDPHWAHNVRAHSPAWIRIGFKTHPVHAHVATGEERERLYEKMCRLSSTTKSYQDMCAPRELPLVVLRPWSRITR